MQKVVIVIHFRPDVDREEAMRYWRDVHGPIVAAVPGVRRYVQNHATSSPEGDLAFDGVVELWFDSREAFESVLASPEWQAVRADAARFVAMESSPVAFVDEVPVV